MPKISKEKLEERRNMILNAALESFADKGYSATTIDDIGKRAGVSKGGIYTYFQSKEDIFLEIAERRLKLRGELVSSTTTSKNAIEIIRRYLRWFLDHLNDRDVKMTIRFSMEFWSVICRDDKGHVLSKERYARFASPLIDILQSGIRAGVVRADLDVPSFVQILLTTLDGIGFGDAVMGVTVSDAVKECYINMMIAYVSNNKNMD